MVKDTALLKITDKRPDKAKIKFCADLIKSGKLVVFPSETVYGLGANALCSEAVKKIFIAKGRPSDNPLIVHVSSIEMAEGLVKKIPDRVREAMNLFWPGPITFVLEKNDKIPDNVTCGLNTVGVRLPSNKIARKIIEISGCPIAAPSANLSGKPSPTKAKHVVDDLFGRVDAIVDGGNASVGLESTVIDVSKKTPVLLRPGGITLEHLEEIFGKIDIANSNAKKPKCPGMKYRHYAPKATFYLFDGKTEREKISKLKKMFKDLQKKGKRVAIIGSQETRKRFSEEYYEDFYMMKERGNLEFLGSKIFNLLRKLDRKEYDYILMGTCKVEGIGRAIMNRVEKASSKIF